MQMYVSSFELAADDSVGFDTASKPDTCVRLTSFLIELLGF